MQHKTKTRKKTDLQPYLAAFSLVAGVLSLVITASYFLSDDQGWGSAAWGLGFGVLAILNLASFLGRIVPWAVHTAERHRPTE